MNLTVILSFCLEDESYKFYEMKTIPISIQMNEPLLNFYSSNQHYVFIVVVCFDMTMN